MGNETEIDTGTTELLASIRNRVVTLTLNRPQKRNALSDQLSPALRDILRKLDSDSSVGCLVLTGAGDAFCAGGDVSGMASSTNSPPTAPMTREDRVRELTLRQPALTLRLHEFSKPTIAALPGPAAGAGFSIALAADLRVMADSAFVTTAFANVGLSGDYGASWFLTQLLGPARAKELFFTSKRVGAAECLELGIANQVVPRGELHAATRLLAEQIANGPHPALRLMKANINRALEVDLATALEIEAQGTIASGASEHHREAVSAFVNKRQPTFKHSQ